ncbi:NAD(+) diphosphatase [Pimelobacter simplex]|uniref:NAD(+) diphosphatase n=1 Tax=Nocardioides simplex TaxID=2045 RepID=A0A0A1DHQ0_NOCSI|nr:NAD(+) diphosphatase [Pimelobacter simplex]AIY16906.1 NADH pyrophosphatase [Pimelobacter simplex]MCG8152037.1 NAD(+) diphosphatase [Pimelobacter simplex]GEB12787.1 NTP pyrophosphohydrolase [Pimelobacter simplex]SFM54294.1 NAD+ diphosphatase [Pimelobacter simplex]
MTFPHVTLVQDPHDRLGLLRTDDAWLAERWADPASRVLVIAGTRVRPGPDGLEWVPAAEAPEGIRLLLGERDGTTWWGVIVPGEVAKAEPERWLPLRGLLPFLSGDAVREAPLVFHALGLAEWHWVHRFCPRCGGTLAARAAGHELVCAECGKPQFPRSDPAVIMLIAAGEAGSPDERCLLGRHPAWPAGRYSTLAGFCEPGESLEDAVRREVLEETGIAVGDVSYFGNQPWPLPSSLMLGFHGRATSEEIRLDDADVEDAQWFTRDDMRRRAEDGSLVLPGGVSISRSLVEDWYGGALPGSW